MSSPLKKSGFVVLAGRSNVGKSTLINALVGSKVAIMTPKPQTTRHPVRGMLNDPRGQIVFVDTPGVFLGKKDAVSQRLNEFVKEQLEGIEAIVYVTDPTRALGPEETMIQELLRQTNVPIILAINKSDLPSLRKPALELMKAIDVGQKMTIECSAIKDTGLKPLVDALFAILPVGEAYYPEFQLTDADQKSWVSELIREKIFLHLEEELPYAIAVDVEHDDLQENGVRHIEATILSNAERYKGMIIGAKGSMLKKIGSAVREELELASGQKVFLALTVKVDPKWPVRFAGRGN
jgi:GTP-binding protein Era